MRLAEHLAAAAGHTVRLLTSRRTWSNLFALVGAVLVYGAVAEWSRPAANLVLGLGAIYLAWVTDR